MSGSNAAALIAVAVVPLIALMLSAFVKTSVVMALLRNALGSPQAPPDLVVTGLSLLLTVFVMAPVARDVVAAIERPAGSAAPAGTPAPEPYHLDLDQAPPDGWLAAAERGTVPVRAFLAKHAHADDRAAFAEVAAELRGAPVADDDLTVLSLAFVASELAEAFAIAFLVFLPFLLIDLIVGVSLTALGLPSVQPQTVALPIKLLLFVAVDGWRLLFVGLLRGYA
ncbi:MAG: EscR/YscR/HrcR family type III secretion system export apparatus protein [Myxococcales bacterium]|nr:EscR/YscR/HrcR family type III secretion system export apparatus protein [Myxococcales bacterium]